MKQTVALKCSSVLPNAAKVQNALVYATAIRLFVSTRVHVTQEMIVNLELMT